MTKIRVSNDRFGLGLLGAVAKSKAGDVLVLREGEYTVEPLNIMNLRIVGVGDPSRIIIRGQLNIVGVCTMSNVTIQAPHFHNAIHLNNAGARVELDSCHVYGEVTWKYPAIYSGKGTIVLRRSTVHYSRAARAVLMEQGSELHAFESSVASLDVDGSRASLTDVGAFSIICRNRGRVEAHASLTLTPGEGKRSLVIQNESVCSVERLQVPEGPWEGLCDDSVLNIGGMKIPAGQSYLVMKQGRALVESASPSVTTKVEGAEPAEDPDRSADPKVLLWRVRDAHNFKTAIAPRLNRGDTVLLEEGEYFLEDYGGVLSLGADITGKGRADKTVINGGLSVMKGSSIAVANLTLRPGAGHNALMQQEGDSASMTNVIFECPAGSELPAVYIGQGTATMTRCRLAASTDVEDALLDVDGGAHLVATDSSLGRLRVWNGSSAELLGCSSVQIWAQHEAKVTAAGGHEIKANARSEREIMVEAGSFVEFGEITTDVRQFEAFVESSSLKIKWLENPEDGVATVLFQGDAEVDVEGRTVTLTRLDASAEEAEEAEESEEDEVAIPPVDEANNDNGPLSGIMSLTGLTTVKDQVQSFTRMVQFNQLRRERGLKTTDLSMHSLFLGNPGTGKTTVARLLGKALFSAGAIPRDVFVEVGRRDLVGEHLGASANMTQRVLESARGGVLFIDEAYSLYKKDHNAFGQEAVDTLLTFMEDNRDDIVVIFAGYTDRMQDFLGMNPGLASRVPNRFDFEDYTPAEIAEIGYRSLLQDDYTVDESLYRRIVASRYGRSTDKSNGRWVRNFNEDLVKQMARRLFSGLSTNPEDLSRIADEDIYQVVGGDPGQKQESVDVLLQQLDGLTGLESVKEWVHKLVTRAAVDKQLMELDGSVSRPNYHMVFAGNPGTGKTTVAQIIARLFYNLGILEKPTVKEVDRSALIGSYIGHTEEKTRRVITEAMGGVLFVDEAYQLSLEGSANDFGKQAIETLMTHLENDRDKFVAIFAGYTENMEQFLGTNPGLRSRIPLTIEFPDYSAEEVGRIAATHLAKAAWAFDEPAVVGAAAGAYAALEPRDKSNGRWARTFAERIEAEHIAYVAAHGITGTGMKRIRPEVIEALAHAQGGRNGEAN